MSCCEWGAWAGPTLGHFLCSVKAWCTLKNCINVNPLAALPGKTWKWVSGPRGTADGKPFFMQKKGPSAASFLTLLWLLFSEAAAESCPGFQKTSWLEVSSRPGLARMLEVPWLFSYVAGASPSRLREKMKQTSYPNDWDLLIIFLGFPLIFFPITHQDRQC